MVDLINEACTGEELFLRTSSGPSGRIAESSIVFSFFSAAEETAFRVLKPMVCCGFAGAFFVGCAFFAGTALTAEVLVALLGAAAFLTGAGFDFSIVAKGIFAACFANVALVGFAAIFDFLLDGVSAMASEAPKISDGAIDVARLERGLLIGLSGEDIGVTPGAGALKVKFGCMTTSTLPWATLSLL